MITVIPFDRPPTTSGPSVRVAVHDLVTAETETVPGPDGSDGPALSGAVSGAPPRGGRAAPSPR